MYDSSVVKMRRQIRNESLQAVEGLTDFELTRIPRGASNSILWNMGHVIYDQYNVLYRVCGLPDPFPPAYKAWFDCFTSPRDWDVTPDIAEVRKHFQTFNDLVLADYEAGKFLAFKPYRLDDKTPVDTIEEAIAFDALHESWHQGVIVTLRRLVASETK